MPPTHLSFLVLLTSLFIATSFLWHRAAAECDLTSGDSTGTIETEEALCLNQGEGYYTFSMSVDLTSLGIPGGNDGPPNPSLAGGSGFQIMDNNCKILGAYERKDCGVPWHIHAGFLPYDLIITDVFMDVGDPYFKFSYANGVYSIRNNHCVCNDMHASFPTARKGCRCAFPIAGQPDKRAVAFQA